MNELESLRALYNAGLRLRQTAPVDDDFPKFMADFDSCLVSSGKVINTTGLNFNTLRDINTKRCRDVFHEVNEWSPCDWANAMAGEVGEVSDAILTLLAFFNSKAGITCDTIKKIRRMEHGNNTAKDPQTESEAIENVALELADTIMYADLLAASLNIDLSEAIIKKFNIVSDRMDSEIKL